MTTAVPQHLEPTLLKRVAFLSQQFTGMSLKDIVTFVRTKSIVLSSDGSRSINNRIRRILNTAYDSNVPSLGAILSLNRDTQAHSEKKKAQQNGTGDWKCSLRIGIFQNPEVLSVYIKAQQ